MRNVRHNVTRVSLLTLIFAATTGSCAIATEQLKDTLVYGYKTFVCYQNPMLGLWHNGDGELPPGKTMPPRLEVASSINWRGYESVWRIADGKLLLESISGRIKGRDVKNRALLPGKKFPVVATWFTGKIHLAVGDINDETQEYESVIVFDIHEGEVRSKTFFPAARVSYSWNGL